MNKDLRVIICHMNLRSISNESGVSYSKLRHFRANEQNLSAEDTAKVIKAIKDLVGGVF